MGMGFLQTFPNNICFSESFSKRVPTLFGSKKGINTKHYDVVVIGSDEVFNCTQKTWFGFSSQLFGKGLNASRIITYAASLVRLLQTNYNLSAKRKLSQVYCMI